MVTDDLFLGGFALTRGGELVRVDLRGTNGRRVAIFTIAGPELDLAERDYYRGESLVDLRLLKLHIRRLKDHAFGALRNEEESHAGDEAGHRADQGRERTASRRR